MATFIKVNEKTLINLDTVAFVERLRPTEDEFMIVVVFSSNRASDDFETSLIFKGEDAERIWRIVSNMWNDQ